MKIEKSIVEIIKYIGDNPSREGLKDTPLRVKKSFEELFCGYKQNPKDILSRVFKDGACKEMVILKDIDFFSTCEHHMLPFYGKVHIGYIPNGRVVGLSKLARLVHLFSRRLQIQEKMTSQIADSIMKYLKPRGCMVVVEAKHLCMLARGVKLANSVMITSAIRKDFRKQEIRNEFLTLRGKR